MSESKAKSPEHESTPDENRDADGLFEIPESEEAAEVSNNLDELKRQLEQANNQYLRAQAELENFRKRTRREMEDERRYASLPLMRDLLSVVDNMQRAIESAEQSEGAAGLLEGVRMVSEQLVAVLEQNHCRRIKALGSPFDPNQHEALGQEPSDEFPPQTITREIRAGYQLHDRVIRPSQVFLSSGPPDAAASGKKTSASGDQSSTADEQAS